MAESGLYKFSHKEVATALVKAAGCNEGIWRLAVEFGMAAANAADATGKLMPVAIIPVVSLAIRRVQELDDLSIDAAEVNPGGRPPAAPATVRERRKRQVAKKTSA